VRDALQSGRIDKARARVFCDWLEDVPEQVAAAVADHLLPKAGRWTTGELKEKIKRLLLAADPGWARRRYERAVQRRRVEGMRHPDGTATITGHQLPVDQAAAAISRVDAIAQKAKRAGLRIPIDHIRTDVFLGLLDGSLAGLDDGAIVAVLLQVAAEAAFGEEDDYDDLVSDDGVSDEQGSGEAVPDLDADADADVISDTIDDALSDTVSAASDIDVGSAPSQGRGVARGCPIRLGNRPRPWVLVAIRASAVLRAARIPAYQGPRPGRCGSGSPRSFIWTISLASWPGGGRYMLTSLAAW
jgi:hypothetical protein